ncbi:MAG TPA: type I-E CRISPR-associated protein Cas5/CasD [Terrimicrobiaceae bacterium]
MKSYPIQLEISGPIALWARPDTMPNPVSYVAPTFGAAKGIFESVLRWKSVNVRPVKCEICAPIQFHRYAFNYGGPLRKSDQISGNSSLQIFAQVLINVRYVIHAEVEFASYLTDDTTWPPHAYADKFQRRLTRGQWFYTPCLGWKEFAPDYVGPRRDDTHPCHSVNEVIPAMLEMVFDKLQRGQRGPGKATYLRQVEIENGVLHYRHGA